MLSRWNNNIQEDRWDKYVCVRIIIFNTLIWLEYRNVKWPFGHIEKVKNYAHFWASLELPRLPNDELYL